MRGVAALDLDPDAERTKSDEMATFAPNAAGFFDLFGKCRGVALTSPESDRRVGPGVRRELP